MTHAQPGLSPAGEAASVPRTGKGRLRVVCPSLPPRREIFTRDREFREMTTFVKNRNQRCLG